MSYFVSWIEALNEITLLSFGITTAMDCKKKLNALLTGLLLHLNRSQLEVYKNKERLRLCLLQAPLNTDCIWIKPKLIFALQHCKHSKHGEKPLHNTKFSENFAMSFLFEKKYRRCLFLFFANNSFNLCTEKQNPSSNIFFNKKREASVNWAMV